MRKQIHVSVLETTVELHTYIACLYLHSSPKRIMATPSNEHSIHNPQSLRVNLVICLLTVLQC